MKLFIVLFLAIIGIIITGCACSDIVDTMTVEQANDKCEDDDHCLKDAGIDALNPLICQEISANGPKSKCLLYVAKGLMDPSLCRAMPAGGGAYSAEECYYQVALAAHDPSICESLDKTTTYPKTDITNKPFDYNDCRQAASNGVKETLKCGDENQPCCITGCNNKQLTCDNTYRCSPCGDPGQTCCTGYCNTGAVCQSSACVACGGPNQACCKDNTCTTEGYACYQGTCKQVII